MVSRMSTDFGAHRILQREAGELGTVEPYRSTPGRGRAVPGWWIALTTDPHEGCTCQSCTSQLAGDAVIWIGPNQREALYNLRVITELHQLEAA